MQTNNKPILVTGSHRSGTTWIGRTISQHHKVRYVQEPFHVEVPNQSMGLKLDTWFTHFESSPQKEQIVTCFNNLFQLNPIQHAIKTCESAGLDANTPLRFIKCLALESILKPKILVKDPIALLSADWLHETYHFQVICMIRNPLGFIGSLKTLNWDFDFENLRKQENLMAGKLNPFASRIEFMCTQRDQTDFIDRAILLWNILHFVILQYQKQYPNWLFVKHEDIAKKPELEFQKIFDYLGLDMSTKIQKYINKNTSTKNPKESATGYYQPRDSKQVLNIWKERLSDEETQRIKKSTNDIVSQLYQNTL